MADTRFELDDALAVKKGRPRTRSTQGSLIWQTDFSEAVTFGNPSYTNNTAIVSVSFSGNAFPTTFSAEAPYLYLIANPGVTLGSGNIADYFTYQVITPPGGIGPTTSTGGKVFHQKLTRPENETQYMDVANGDILQMCWWCHPKDAFNHNRLIYHRFRMFWRSDMWTAEIPNAQSGGNWTNWKIPWEYKTGTSLTQPGSNNGDFRLMQMANSGILGNGAGPRAWSCGADNNAGGGYAFSTWRDWGTNGQPQAPVGEWFTVETLVKHGVSGKIAVNGKVVMDSAGRPMVGAQGHNINRYWLTQLYSGGIFSNGGIQQWVSSVEIYADGVPANATIS